MSVWSKFDVEDGERWVPHQYGKVFTIEKSGDSDRLKLAVSGRGSQMLLDFASKLEGPFAVLYVLVVPRGGGADGRYQSPWMNHSELKVFLERFGSFFDQDGRHHVWLRSDYEKATIVYDRHNLIFAYGPLSGYLDVLRELEYSQVKSFQIPSPHAHNYHVEFDGDEGAILAAPGWLKSPLREADGK